MNFLYNNEAYQANIPKYKHWLEGNREIYLSSAFYRDHWKNMFDDHRGEKTFYYSRRADLYKKCYVSWGNREDMISSCKINKNEIERLI